MTDEGRKGGRREEGREGGREGGKEGKERDGWSFVTILFVNVNSRHTVKLWIFAGISESSWTHQVCKSMEV